MTQNTKTDITTEIDTQKDKKVVEPKASSGATKPSPKAGRETPPTEKKAAIQPSTTSTARVAPSVTATPSAKTPSSAASTTPKVASKIDQGKTAQAETTQAKPPRDKAPEKPASEAGQGTSPASENTEQRPTMVSAAATADHKKLPPGIDAMALLKRSESGKEIPPSKKTTAHRSAAEVIAKTASRDHAKPAAVPQAKAEKLQSNAIPKTATKSRMTPKTPIPPEPKGPIGGIEVRKPAPVLVPGEAIAAVLNAELRDPFAFFGVHKIDATGAMMIRVFYPEATAIEVLDSTKDKVIGNLSRVHDEGLFVGEISGRKQPFPYRLRVSTPAGKADVEDPYRFPPVLSDKDVAELIQGESIYNQLGAHSVEMEGVPGVAFTVWAPNASRVSLVGDFNGWDGRRHGMRLRGECGVWEIFLPEVKIGALYKYEIKQSPEAIPELKSDPIAFSTETPLGTASIVCGDGKAFPWRDESWIKNRETQHNPSKPSTFYEVHLGSWRRKPEEDNRWFTYREMADELVTYCHDLGFTHIALLPVSEYTYDDTVGYLPSNLYAPTNRYGSPDDFRYFIDACHRVGLGVVVDWVHNYFSEEEHGLAFFDGAALYEYSDSSQRRDPDWNAPLYDLTRKEVVNYLISNAMYWFEHFHLDGLRISGLAKMFYLDYGRSDGSWSPNEHGGNENLEALAFIRRLNE
ncbi:MAG: hypothetical protein HKP13_06930, partial [Gammaproteobacteria bacterium]|nr:hypothetical protein [Gammaproteobacteria bacterium]